TSRSRDQRAWIPTTRSVGNQPPQVEGGERSDALSGGHASISDACESVEDRVVQWLARDADVADREEGVPDVGDNRSIEGSTDPSDVRRGVERVGEMVVEDHLDTAVRRNSNKAVGAVERDPEGAIGCERHSVGVGIGELR